MYYITCLNSQFYQALHNYMTEDIVHNGKRIGLAGFIQLIKGDRAKHEWLHFNVSMLVVDDAKQTVACRLILKGQDPEATDLPREHAFYQFRGGKITEVWSMLDGFEQ